MVGPEYPGEGAVQNIYSRVSSCKQLQTQPKKSKSLRKFVLDAQPKKA